MHGAVRLDDWGVVMASGADAAAFLHGQLTQDVLHLPAGQARLAGYCSPKGRLLASFWLWREPSDGAADGAPPPPIALVCSADLLAPTVKRLSMFVLRSQCHLSDARDRRVVWGLVGPAVRAWAGDATDAPAGAVQRLAQGTLVRLPDAQGLPRWLWVAPAGAEPTGLPTLAPGQWAWLEVHSGIARVTAATVDQFVPQMVNLELTGGVNFQKGCYPGQEVVARSQYRGTLKRRMFAVLADAPLMPGQEVVHDSDPGQPAGVVVLAAPAAVATDALVALKSALADAPGALRAGNATLRLATLPYALPAEASTAA